MTSPAVEVCAPTHHSVLLLSGQVLLSQLSPLQLISIVLFVTVQTVLGLEPRVWVRGRVCRGGRVCGWEGVCVCAGGVEGVWLGGCVCVGGVEGVWLGGCVSVGGRGGYV